MTVTQVEAGKEHNVIPAKVNIVVDVRVNDKYTNEEAAEILIKEDLVAAQQRLHSFSAE